MFFLFSSSSRFLIARHESLEQTLTSRASLPRFVGRQLRRTMRNGGRRPSSRAVVRDAVCGLGGGAAREKRRKSGKRPKMKPRGIVPRRRTNSSGKTVRTLCEIISLCMYDSIVTTLCNFVRSATSRPSSRELAKQQNYCSAKRKRRT